MRINYAVYHYGITPEFDLNPTKIHKKSFRQELYLKL